MKSFFKFSIALAIAAFPVFFSSCAKDEGEDNLKVVPVTTTMSPEECKDYIQQTCMEAVGMINAGDFKPVAESIMEIAAAFENGVTPVESLQEWMGKVSEALGSSITHYDRTIEGYELIESFQDITITLAPFTGHITIAADGTASYQSASDFWVKALTASNVYELLLTKSDKLCEFQVIENDNWVRETPYSKRTDNGFVKVSLPEDINLVLKKNGSSLADVKMHIAVKPKDNAVIQTNGELNVDALIGAKAQISMEVKMAGYSVSVDELKYEGQDLAASLSLSKNGTGIINATFKAADIDLVEDDMQTLEIKMASVSIDVLKKLQVKGKASVSNLISAIDCAYENDQDEALFKASVDKVNGYLDLGIYFGSDAKQAGVVFAPFFVNYPDYQYWEMEPVLLFNDGSAVTYSFEDYFDAASFSNLLEKVQTLMGDFSALVSGTE